MTRQRTTTTTRSSFRYYLFLPLILSLLFTLHGILVTRKFESSNARYFDEDDDTQWRLNVMMGRGAPFDNLLDVLSGGNYNYETTDSLADDYDNLDSSADDEIKNNEPPVAEKIKSKVEATKQPTKARNDNNNEGNAAQEENLKEKLRPKRNPKGQRFRGWMHPEEFNFWTQSDDDIGNDIDSNNDNNNYRAWWRNNSRCFEIDYICHRVQSNKWAYMKSSNKERVFQPTMELKPSAWKYDGAKYSAELRVGIQVDSPSLIEKSDRSEEEFSFEQCQLSKTNTHIVLQSVFNDMLGEFYSRSLLKLHQTMMMAVQKDDDDKDDDDKDDDDAITNNEATPSQTSQPPLPWEEDIQFYIHIPLKGKEVLDGHKLLTAGMLSNPNAGMAMSFLDLFQTPPPENKENGTDDDDCQCYRKMVFCGYDAYTHDEQVNSEDIDTVEDNDDGKEQQEEEEEVETESNNGEDDDDGGEQELINSKKETGSTKLLALSEDIPPSFNPNLKYTLWSSGTLAAEYKGKGASHVCSRGGHCQGYANLRNLMSSNFVKHYPSLSDDIVKFRREALLAKSLIDDDYSGDTKEWLVVGLTQRNYRRAWLNLPTVLKQCNTKLNDRSVIFIEVNVEETSSPYEQLILHRSLDVLIGVHGAQLTQAVVLPPYAHVLEILPWVPSYIRGNWVTRRDGPTPLGVIYHNTDLNHAGYSLDRTSTDLCVGVGEVGSEEEKECFLSRRKIFIWDNRDFNVDPKVVIQYIENLVLFMRDDEMGKQCAEVKGRLDDRFVLYNVWCAEEEESTLSVSHYYAETGPQAEGEQYGMGKRKRRKKGLHTIR